MIEIWRGIEGCESCFLFGMGRGAEDELGRRDARRVGVFREAGLLSAGAACWASGVKRRFSACGSRTRWTWCLVLLETSRG